MGAVDGAWQKQEERWYDSKRISFEVLPASLVNHFVMVDMVHTAPFTKQYQLLQALKVVTVASIQAANNTSVVTSCWCDEGTFSTCSFF